MKPRLTENVARFLATARCLLDIIPDGVVVILASGHVVYANPSAARFVEQSVEDLIGRQITDLNGSEWQDVARVFQDGRPQMGVQCSYKRKPYIASRLPLKIEGKILAVVSFFQGLFKYDTYALELESYKQMANMLDAIMESSYDGLWITDKQGTVVKLNKAAERITGCSAAEVLGKNVAFLVAEGIVDKSVTAEVLERGTTVTMVQRTRLNKKVLATGNPIFNSEGKINAVIINDRDITELDRMQKELENSQALLDFYRHELSDLQLSELEINFHVCRSDSMEKVYEKCLKASRFDSTVLMTGESGVGKGLLAKLIHQKSKRCHGPFIRVDCSAIAETLFESEVFGYEKWAFTGAGPKGKLGLVETATGGTLFLDEIAEVPVNLQTKLLRFLEEGCLVRVGGTAVRKVDARVIAATNKNLLEQIRKNHFREDLFYRLNVISLPIPPLRERPEDIPGLIGFFMRKFGKKYGLRKHIEREAIDALIQYDFPGNIRELQNIIESIIVLSPANSITTKDLPPDVRHGKRWPLLIDDKKTTSLWRLMNEVSTEHIVEAVGKCGSQRKAAKRLGINQSTISRRLKKRIENSQ